MLYSALTPENKAALDSFMAMALRPLAGDLARLCNKLDAAAIQWNINISTIVTSLDAGAIISDPRSLSGAIPLTKEEAQSLITLLGGLLAAYNRDQDRILYAKACGALNTV